MEESKNGKNNMCTGCCAHCEHCPYQKHCLLRWVLGIVIILLVFWLGIAVGRFSGFIKYGEYGGYGMHRMMGDGYWKGAPGVNSGCFPQNPSAPVAE